MTAPVRAVVVDDSPSMRAMIRAALEEEGDVRAVGLAADSLAARRLIRSEDPDVVTLDVEMPGMNGLEFLEKIMRLRPTPVVMVSSHAGEGAEATIAALQIGAVDVVRKPDASFPPSQFRRVLREKVRLAAQARARFVAIRPALARSPAADPRAAGFGSAEAPGASAWTRDLIAIGASTGGVAALTELLEGLPQGAPPVVAVQHMPEGFTGRFARRLRDRLGRDVAEARDGEALVPGMVRIAPGDSHLTLARARCRLVTRLGDGSAVSGHRPSVDVLFDSVARLAGRRAVGVILTGMGRDGAAGLRAMRRAGAACLGQSENSCVVYGMPRAARELDAVDEEADLDRLAQCIVQAARAPSAARD